MVTAESSDAAVVMEKVGAAWAADDVSGGTAMGLGLAVCDACFAVM